MLTSKIEYQKPIKVDIIRVEEVEMDEMWSFVGSKKNQRWLWHAIDHDTHKVLAYHIGSHKDESLVTLKNKLKTFDISFYYTDNWFAYKKLLSTTKHIIGKRKTQAIERKHLTLRARIKRLARKTICFSKLEKMHDIVLGLFINKFEFGMDI